VSPFGKKSTEEMVSARAIVLSPIWPTTGLQSVSLAIQLDDGRTVFASPTLGISAYFGVIHAGGWVPIKLLPDKPDSAEIDAELVPETDDVVAVISEALGGPAVQPVAPNEWRVNLGLQFAERIISGGALSAAQAEAIRSRIRAGF